MKTLKYLSMLLVALLAMSACGGSSSKEGETPEKKHTVVGEWKMVSWSTLTNAEIYVSFNADATFDLYQRLYTPEFIYLGGRFTYKSGEINGVYTDTTPWGSGYKVTFNDAGTQMTFTAVKDPSDKTVFSKSSIPAEIRALKPAPSPTPMTTKADEVRFF